MNQTKRVVISKNFFLDEFCPKEIYDKIVEQPNRLYDYLDKRIVSLVQWIRDKTGQPVLINNWYGGGQLDERCIRTPNTSTGASKSRHKFIIGQTGTILKKADAVDINIGNWTAEQMYNWANENKRQLYILGLRTVEDYRITGGIGAGWMHMDLYSRIIADKVICIVDIDSIEDKWIID